MSDQGQFVVFSLLEPKFCVAKLGSDADLSAIPIQGEFFSITKSGSDVSLVCEEELAPKGVDLERNWRCLKVQGPLEFSLKGVLVSLLEPLAAAGIAVFAVSTYETDYILVKQYNLGEALKALELAGHRLTTD